MLSKTLRRAATLGVAALVPIVAANVAMAANNHEVAHHDDHDRRLQSSFEVPAGATKTLIPGGEIDPYRVCASPDNVGYLWIHFGQHTEQALRPGQCQTFETSKLTIANPAKIGNAYGTYRRAIL